MPVSPPSKRKRRFRAIYSCLRETPENRPICDTLAPPENPTFSGLAAGCRFDAWIDDRHAFVIMQIASSMCGGKVPRRPTRLASSGGRFGFSVPPMTCTTRNVGKSVLWRSAHIQATECNSFGIKSLRNSAFPFVSHQCKKCGPTGLKAVAPRAGINHT